MRKIKGVTLVYDRTGDAGHRLGYLTRNTVAAAAPTLMEECTFQQQYSYIIAAYSAAYAVMQPVCRLCARCAWHQN